MLQSVIDQLDHRVHNFEPNLCKKEGNKLMLITSCAKNQAIPIEFCLNQNYPNPFKRKTTIKYGIPYKTKVILIVHNSIGGIVEKLISKEQEAGIYEVEFFADGLAEGTYFYRIRARDNVTDPMRSKMSGTLGNWSEVIRITYNIPGGPSGIPGFELIFLLLGLGCAVFAVEIVKKVRFEQFYPM